MKMKKGTIILFFLCLLSIFGCTGEDKDTNKDNWKESPTFIHDGKTMYGVEGKVGIVKENGEEKEPFFPATQGRLYNISFFEDAKEFYGKEAKITATNQNTGDTVELAKIRVSSTMSSKLSFNKEGLWKVDITIEDKPFTSFVIKAEKPIKK